MNHSKTSQIFVPNQTVEFLGWVDQLDHKNGPQPGDQGTLVEVLKSAESHANAPVYIVGYDLNTPSTRTIYHFPEEIALVYTPTDSPKEKTPNVPRLQAFAVSPN